MSTNACVSKRPIPKATVIADSQISRAGRLVFDAGTGSYRPNFRTWLSSLDQANWAVTAFDPKSREVCIDVNNGKVPVHVAITLPYLTASKI